MRFSLLAAISLSLLYSPLDFIQFYSLSASLAFAQQVRNPQPNCTAQALQSILPDRVTLLSHTALRANSTHGEPSPGFARVPTGLPALCAVTLQVQSAPDVNATHRIAMFLPLPSDWKDRTILIGTGGSSGGFNWLDMAPTTHMGFATASTDTGHISDALNSSWALNDIEKQVDWGWRAMHNTVNITRAVVSGYYGREAKHKYYHGCSTAGRQGLKEVQLDASSFDGVLLGAPAWWTKRISPWVTKVGLDNLPVDDPKHINYTRWPTLATEVVRQCDEVDGVKDGIVSAPDACVFDYEQILCGGRGQLNAADCFTEPQIGVIKAALSDWVDPERDNALLHPGMTLGSENDWYILMGGHEPSAFGPEYLRNFVYSDKNWTWANGNFSTQTVYDAERLDKSNATADKFDLHEFRDRGGKILMYHGLSDALVIPKGSDYYYDRVIETTSGGDLNATRNWFQYFKVPGMSHCGLTAPSIGAPWAFGGPSQAPAFGTDTWSVPGFKDEEHDILMALIKWVEEDRPVDSVIATTWEDQFNVSTPVRRQRPICAVPFVATYDGKGDIDKASSWSCEISESPGSGSGPRPPQGAAVFSSIHSGLAVFATFLTISLSSAI